MTGYIQDGPSGKLKENRLRMMEPLRKPWQEKKCEFLLGWTLSIIKQSARDIHAMLNVT